jgi:hypothetical protein
VRRILATHGRSRAPVDQNADKFDLPERHEGRPEATCQFEWHPGRKAVHRTARAARSADRSVGVRLLLDSRMPAPANLIDTYIQAKDSNRPHLLDATFLDDATLHMVVRSDAISFAPFTEGREAIADSLVRQFNISFENIYTLCIGEPPAANTQIFSCDWLVAMSDKDAKTVRVGCGRYDWTFARERVQSLTISIEAMEILAPETLSSIVGWASGLPYPWCPREGAIATWPDLSELGSVLRYMLRDQ